MAQPAPFSNAPTDDDIDYRRRMAQRLMQQGTSTEPVGHWSAALARALQGASGGAWDNQARQGEQQAEASVQSALSGKMDPRQLMLNPRTRGIGVQMYQSAQSDARAEGRERRAEERAARDPLRQVQIQQAQLGIETKRAELERARRQQELDDAVLGGGQAPAPAQAPAAPPMPTVTPAMGARAAASEEGPTRAGGFSAPLMPAPQPQQPAQSNLPASVQEARALRDRLPPEQQMVFNQLWRRGQYEDALKMAQQSLVPPKKSVTELKQIYETDNSRPQLASTLDTLRRAEKLISPEAETQGTAAYEGMGAGLAGYVGSRVPYGDKMFDKTRSKSTDEWGTLMSLEAVKAMAEALTGATTNFELKTFVDILADPSQPRDIRRRTLQRMRQLAEQQLNLANRRSQELRTGEYYRAPNGQSGAAGVSTGRAIDLGDGFTVEIE
jgi:hypothetical protein